MRIDIFGGQKGNLFSQIWPKFAKFAKFSSRENFVPFESSVVGWINSILCVLQNNGKIFRPKNKIVGALIMVLSKAFDCHPHDLFIVKLDAYGFDTKTQNILNLNLIKENSL